MNKDIIYINEKYSDSTIYENKIYSSTVNDHYYHLNTCSIPSDYYETEIAFAVKEIDYFFPIIGSDRLKILDVGAGRGESSVFLAERGHQVYAVEPCEDLCELIALAAAKFNLDIVPVCTIGERTSRLNMSNFDLVIFHASLHHCDDPYLAVGEAFKVLKQNGRILLLSETHMRPWVRKKWWYRQLKINPEKMGHYGGNEHAYYTWEYAQMLKKAGFKGVKKYPVRMYVDPLVRIEIGIKQRKDGTRNWSESKFFLRSIYYLSISKFIKIPGIFWLLATCSIIPAEFLAIRK